MVKTEHQLLVKKHQLLSFPKGNMCQKSHETVPSTGGWSSQKCQIKFMRRNVHAFLNSQLVITDESKNHQLHHKWL
jgi:hypothetical protein